MTLSDPIDQEIASTLHSMPKDETSIEVTDRVLGRIHRRRRIRRSAPILVSLGTVLLVAFFSFSFGTGSEDAGQLKTSSIDSSATTPKNGTDVAMVSSALFETPVPVDNLSLIDQQQQTMLTLLESLGDPVQ